MVIRVDPQNIPTLLVLRRQFLELRPHAGPVTDQDIGRFPHAQCTAILHTAGGYAIFHPGEWELQPVLWVDELFLQPAARKRGLFKELVDWIRNYCEYNGLPTVMGMAFSFEEALPLKTHLALTPVAQILRISVERLHYRPAEQQLAAVPVPQAEPKRPRKPRMSRKEREQRRQDSIRRVDEMVNELEAEDHRALAVPPGAVVQHRSGIVLPLPDAAESM